MATFNTVYALTRDRCEIGYDLLDLAAVATDAEMVVDQMKSDGYALAARVALDLTAHLLGPLLEPSLRYVLRLAGQDPAIKVDDITEEEVALTALLSRLSPKLEKRNSANMMLEVELLLHNRPWSALRHTVAHGLIGTGGCFSIDAVYAGWLLYQLTCLPILVLWAGVIAPRIEVASKLRFLASGRLNREALEVSITEPSHGPHSYKGLNTHPHYAISRT